MLPEPRWRWGTEVKPSEEDPTLPKPSRGHGLGRSCVMRTRGRLCGLAGPCQRHVGHLRFRLEHACLGFEVRVVRVFVVSGFHCLRGGPHREVPDRDRCGNRDLGPNGGRTRWVHLGETVGVSELSLCHVPPGKSRNTDRKGRFETQLTGNVKDSNG